MSERARSFTSPTLDVDALLDDPSIRIVVCCGSGGVGKTTTSAALAVRAADRGRTVAVLTIDPARRLAQALGLTELGNEPGRVAGVPDTPGVADTAGGGPAGNGAARNGAGPGELHAMMLDMRRTFDEMVQTHTTPDRAAAILANPFYQTISSSFSGTQEYMAMEKLGQLAATKRWDLIIVDTPPSRSALDFLDAPQRMSTFLDGRMIRLLASPARAGGRSLRKVLGAGFSLFTKAVSTILGGQLLSDASAFVQAFDTMFGGFRERATATYALLRSPGTAFVVIAAPEPDALREAAYFVDRLRSEDMPLAGLVLNRTHPVLAPLSATRARDAADELSAAPLAAAVLRLHADRVDRAAREDRLLARFAGAHPAVAVTRVPAVAGDVSDLDGLREIGSRLAAGDPGAAVVAVDASEEPEPAGRP
jgi:anion-transporting  ArsA/GET3 family ATPase